MSTLKPGRPSLPRRAVEFAYLRLFGRRTAQRLNDYLLNLALRARGYDNFQDADSSGEAAFLDRLAAQAPALCIDVGANVGGYSRRLLEQTGSRVLAFEPLPLAFRQLSTLQAKFPERFECFNVGMADRRTELELHFGAGDSEHASFSAEVSEIDYVGRSNVNRMFVPVTTLDDFLVERFPAGTPPIDLIKIDTEGFEFEVLAGASRTIETVRPRYLQLEFNLHQMFRGRTLLDLTRRLLGYRVYQMLPHGGGLAPRDPRSTLANVYRFSNFVFVRDDIVID